MKRIVLAFSIFILSSFTQTDNKFWIAGEELIKTLRAQSPKFDGADLRDYSYQDLNFDGKYEIIEKQNKIEESATGFLNVELYPAFELHRIFTYSGGKFQKDYSKFQWYLEKRIVFYKFWKKQLQNPINLSSDSQELIKANKAMFLKEIDRLINLNQSLIDQSFKK